MVKWVSSGLWGVPDAAASASIIRFMLSITRSRVSGTPARMFNLKSASCGIMFSLSPALIAETVSTAKSDGSTSRDTIVCNRRIVDAAWTIGSILTWGIDACACLPSMCSLKESAEEAMSPCLVPTSPTKSQIRFRITC